MSDVIHYRLYVDGLMTRDGWSRRSSHSPYRAALRAGSADPAARIAFTTYQAGKLFLLGLKPDGRLGVFE